MGRAGSIGVSIVHGIGINDADYVLHTFEVLEDRLKCGRKKRRLTWACPYYKKWSAMIARCYSDAYQAKYPSYRGCIVCEEWLLFSSFRKWMVGQEWEGLQLDKDLLLAGNKVYSPETCVFVPRRVNMFLTDCSAVRGNYLLGVSRNKNCSRFEARISVTTTGKSTYLGSYVTEEEAHLVWKERKHQYACDLANSKYVVDERVADILRQRYKNYTVVEEHLK